MITQYYNQKIKESAGIDDAHIALLRKKSKELERKINNTMDIMIDSGSNALMGKLHEFENEQKLINEQLERLTRKSIVYVTEEQIKALFRKGRKLLQKKTLPSLQKLIQIFVDSIVIYSDRVHILFNFSDKKYLPQRSPENDDTTADIAPQPNACHDDFHDENVANAGGGEGSGGAFTD